MSEVARLWSN